MVPSPWRWWFLKLPKYIALFELMSSILQCKLAVALEAALHDGAVILGTVGKTILARAVRLTVRKVAGIACTRQEVFDGTLTLDDTFEELPGVYTVGRSESSISVRNIVSHVAGIEAALVAHVLNKSGPLVNFR